MLHNKLHTITIEKLITGGYGLGRLPDGMVVHVPYVIPDEKVTVKVIRKQKTLITAELVEILLASLWREKPCCKHFGICGGCNLQHIAYDKQVFFKEQILLENLQRARVGNDNQLQNVLQPPATALQPYHYRKRIRLHVDSHKGRFGFYHHQSHRIEPIIQCPIASPIINEVMQLLHGSVVFRQLLSHLISFELTESDADGTVILILFLARKQRAHDKAAVNDLVRLISPIKAIYLDYQGMRSAPFTAANVTEDIFIHMEFDKEVAGRELQLTQESGGFIQVNQQQNKMLVSKLLEWAGEISSARILDLFCGMGNFSLPLAVQAKQVVGMDLQRSAIRSAKRNAALNNLENCIFEQQSAESGGRDLCKQKEKFDLVLLDPPRQGCKEVIPYLLKIAPDKIVYISCDPATLARDLALLGLSKYQLEKMQLIDMFPQTHHMETICYLHRK